MRFTGHSTGRSLGNEVDGLPGARHREQNSQKLSDQ